MSFYIGLSIQPYSKTNRSEKAGSAEGRRILSLFDEIPVNVNSIIRDENGRPFLPDGDIDFNISHSGSLTAVSLVKGNNLRTGCDVERIRRRKGAPEIAEMFFSLSERNYIFSRGKIDEIKFYEIWTLKECFLKLRGLSVFNMAAAPSFIKDKDSSERFHFNAIASWAISFRLYRLSDGLGEDYLLATAIEGSPQIQPEIRWFSQSALVCKMTAEIKAAPNPAATVNPNR